MAAALGAAALLAGGGVWWWLAGRSEPEPVAVPPEVCGGALPAGRSVAALLPAEGAPYAERLTPDFTLPSGFWCGVTAGGVYLDFDYWRDVSSAYDEELAEQSRSPANARIRRGTAHGYANESKAVLFVDCPSPSSGREETLKVQVQTRMHVVARGDRPVEEFERLVGDAARYVAAQVGCAPVEG
ncbi:hypothetical protein [Streptomyces laurentii]